MSRLNSGMRSGVALAGANKPQQPGRDDGILTALEAQQLDLSGTDLIVLSACETSLGSSTRGEGMLGLQRAFQVAGVRTAVTSLWSVDDNATEVLMVEFYKNLWQRKLSKLESLRQAQLTMLRDYDPTTGTLRGPGITKSVDPQKLDASVNGTRKHLGPLPPYYWAAFTLSGDWR